MWSQGSGSSLIPGDSIIEETCLSVCLCHVSVDCSMRLRVVALVGGVSVICMARGLLTMTFSAFLVVT